MSKGSSQRPAAVPRETVDERWEHTFGKQPEGDERAEDWYGRIYGWPQANAAPERKRTRRRE